MSGFGADEIRIGEAIFRAEGHLAVSCELYGAGRKADALLQAARPATDILPSLEMDLRGADAALRGFFAATARIGAAIRRNEKPRGLRRALREVERASRGLLEAAVGTVVNDPSPSFRASVGIALLDRVSERYRRAVEEEDLGEYQNAYVCAHTGTDLLVEAGGRVGSLNEVAGSLRAAFPGVEPPERLVRPGDVQRIVDAISELAIEELGAIRLSWTLADSLGRIDRLLGDVLVSYEKGLGPLSARLAASLFVRAYDPVRRELGAASPDAEARLTSLLGFELRRAINEGAEPDRVRALATEAHEILIAAS